MKKGFATSKSSRIQSKALKKPINVAPLAEVLLNSLFKFK